MRKCIGCGELKPKEEYRKKQSRCKQCQKIYNKEYVARNKEKLEIQWAEYRSKNKDKAKVYISVWQKQNADKVSKNNKAYTSRYPDRVKARHLEYSKNNRDKYNAATTKYRTAKAQRTAPWADEGAIKAIYKEAARITKETGIPHHVDHIVPLQGKTVSGLHWEGNLQILTGSDNQSKGNRLVANG